MALFPVEYSLKGSEGIVDALNYVLSGPSGLGQNFGGFNNSYDGILVGAIRNPAAYIPIISQCHGASGAYEITAATPGTVWTRDAVLTSRIQAGMYVRGTNIGVGAQVAETYDPTNTPYTVPLTEANTGWVVGPIEFFEVNLDPTVLPTPIYVAAIDISTIVWIDTHTIQVNFATSQTTAPFVLGCNPTIAGNTFYNGTYTAPGVVECTTEYCIIQFTATVNNPGAQPGGTIKLTNTLQPPPVGTDYGFLNNLYWNQTDMSSIAIVNGAQDRVFISAQIQNTLNYISTAASDIEYTVAINRYVGVQPTTVNTFTGATFFFDATVAQQSYKFPVFGAGSGTLNGGLPVETIFTTVIDAPQSNAYRYRIDVLFRVTNDSGAADISYSVLGPRSISTQVIKQ
jgi:hypothetical protein